MTVGPRTLLGALAVFAVIVLAHPGGVPRLGWAGTALDWLRGLDARIWQAVIAGGFLAVGWVVNGWRDRRDGAKLRAERLRDAHRALFAEIDVNLTNLWSEARLDAHCADMIARMEADPTFVPLVPRERHDRLFRALEPEIHVLPRVTIDPIVKYHALLSAIEMLVEDLRSKTFGAFDVPRRAAIYSDYIEMRKQALLFGRLANRLIQVYAEEGKDAAEAEALRLSSRAAGPSAT